MSSRPPLPSLHRDTEDSLSQVPPRRAIRLDTQPCLDSAPASQHRHVSPFPFTPRDVNLLLSLPTGAVGGTKTFSAGGTCLSKPESATSSLHRSLTQQSNSNAQHSHLHGRTARGRMSSSAARDNSRHRARYGGEEEEDLEPLYVDESTVMQFTRTDNAEFTEEEHHSPHNADATTMMTMMATTITMTGSVVVQQQMQQEGKTHYTTSSMATAVSRSRAASPAPRLDPLDSYDEADALPYAYQNTQTREEEVTRVEVMEEEAFQTEEEEEESLSRLPEIEDPFQQPITHTDRSVGKSAATSSTPPPRRAFVLSRLPSDSSQTAMSFLSAHASSANDDNDDDGVEVPKVAAFSQLGGRQNEAAAPTATATIHENDGSLFEDVAKALVVEKPAVLREEGHRASHSIVLASPSHSLDCADEVGDATHGKMEATVMAAMMSSSSSSKWRQRPQLLTTLPPGPGVVVEEGDAGATVEGSHTGTHGTAKMTMEEEEGESIMSPLPRPIAGVYVGSASDVVIGASKMTRQMESAGEAPHHREDDVTATGAVGGISLDVDSVAMGYRAFPLRVVTEEDEQVPEKAGGVEEISAATAAPVTSASGTRLSDALTGFTTPHDSMMVSGNSAFGSMLLVSGATPTPLRRLRGDAVTSESRTSQPELLTAAATTGQLEQQASEYLGKENFSSHAEAEKEKGEEESKQQQQQEQEQEQQRQLRALESVSPSIMAIEEVPNTSAADHAAHIEQQQQHLNHHSVGDHKLMMQPTNTTPQITDGRNQDFPITASISPITIENCFELAHKDAKDSHHQGTREELCLSPEPTPAPGSIRQEQQRIDEENEGCGCDGEPMRQRARRRYSSLPSVGEKTVSGTATSPPPTHNSLSLVGTPTITTTTTPDQQQNHRQQQRHGRRASASSTSALATPSTRVSDEVKELVEKAQEEVRRTRESLLATLNAHKVAFFPSFSASSSHDTTERKAEGDSAVSSVIVSGSDASRSYPLDTSSHHYSSGGTGASQLTNTAPMVDTTAEPRVSATPSFLAGPLSFSTPGRASGVLLPTSSSDMKPHQSAVTPHWSNAKELRQMLVHASGAILRRLKGYDSADHGVLPMDVILCVTHFELTHGSGSGFAACATAVGALAEDTVTPARHALSAATPGAMSGNSVAQSQQLPLQHAVALSSTPNVYGSARLSAALSPALITRMSGAIASGRKRGRPHSSVIRRKPHSNTAVGHVNGDDFDDDGSESDQGRPATCISPTRTLERVLAQQEARVEEEAYVRFYTEIHQVFREVFGERYAWRHIGATNASRQDMRYEVADLNELPAPLETHFPRLRQHYSQTAAAERQQQQDGVVDGGRWVPPLDMLVYYKTFVESLKEL